MGFRILLSLLVIIVSTWTLLCAQINGTEFENSVVVSSLSLNPFAQKHEHINILRGTPYDFEKEVSYFHIGLTNFNTRLMSLGVDYARRRLFIFDINTGEIHSVENFNWEENFRNISLKHIHDGLSRSSLHISVDWVANNIYWTDPLFGWIVVQSVSKKNIYKILVKDDIEKPLALVVNPIHKFIFWSDVGSTVKIERASLSGSNRKSIISTGLANPISFDIDYSASKLVWVDSARDTVETANFDGGDRKVIRRMSHSEFYDVAVFRDLISVTDLRNGSLVILNKNTGAAENSLSKRSGDPFVAIALYTADVQQTLEDLCKSKGCSDICVHENDGPVCMCAEGFKLNEDGVSCSEDLGKFHRAFMWSNSSDICMMDIRSLTSNGHTDTLECFFRGGRSITHFEIDMSDRKVIFVDGQNIYSANIGQNPVKQRIISTNEIITGIAVDWRDNNVYWCMGTTTGTIRLVSQETLDSYTLVSTDLTSPRDLNILPFHDTIVWMSGTSGAFKIEKSELAGSGRQTLVSGGSLVSPKGLTVDHSTTTLYFIDGGYVKSCDINGKELATLKPSSSLISPKMVMTYKNYLAVADSSYPASVLQIFEKSAEPAIKFKLSAIDVDSMTDMKVLDALLQPDRKGPCVILNGDCEQICIPIGRNRLCQCEYGFQLDSNKESCSSVPLTDNFLLVTDWTHNQMYQISLVNDDVKAVDTDTYGSPIGIVYNHVTQQVIWSTNELVHSIGLNDTRYRVILNTEMLGCHADRFAIDYSSGNIYYTANLASASVTGFIGIGVISPEGLHKRLISFGVRPRAVVLDPEQGLLFWTDHGYDPAFIRKANMDGSNMQTVIQVGLVWPNGLAIDTEAKLLYVTDGSTNVIHRCTYKGVCTTYYKDNEAHLMDIELLGDYLYYTAWNRPYITKLHKTNPSIVSKAGFKPELGRLDAVSLYSSTATPPSVSAACSPSDGRHPCSTFCLPTPSGYKCACEDGVALLSDRKTCENAKTSTTTPTTTTSTTSTATTTTTTTSMTSTATTTTTTSMTSTATTTRSTTATSFTTSTSTAAVTTPASNEKQNGLPIPVIAGASTGFIVLAVIIVILVLVILKRKKTKDRGSRAALQYQPGFDISFVTPPPFVDQQRPDSTYDLIKFDEPDQETKMSKETNDNLQNDYMRLNLKPNDYEDLNSVRRAEQRQNFRPSALPNEYQTMSATTRIGSNNSLDDYLLPINAAQNTSVNDDFNNPIYVGDSTGSNTSPFSNPLNAISTISYKR